MNRYSHQGFCGFVPHGPTERFFEQIEAAAAEREDQFCLFFQKGVNQ